MITVAVVNSKGGVGKTTLSAALAVQATRESQGKARVAMVDLDPQRSLVEWWKRRGKKADSPTIFEGVDSAIDAIERAERDGWDWLFLDGPPAFLVVMEEMVSAADFTLIPVRPSVVDLLSSEDAVVLAREADAAFLVVLNDVGAQEREKVVRLTREALFSSGVPIAETEIIHRVAHMTGMNTGKSASEIKGASAAAAEIERLWAEVKTAAIKAHKARTRKAVAHG